jgi:hypothetical protein
MTAIFSVLLLSDFAEAAEVLKKEARKKAEVLSLLSLTEGHYDTVVSKGAKNSLWENFCQNEELDIELIEDEAGTLTLVFGSILNFPHLETNQYTENEPSHCTITFNNKIETKNLKQEVISDCHKKRTIKSHQIEFGDKKINYTLTVSGKKLTCHYILIPKKGAQK